MIGMGCGDGWCCANVLTYVCGNCGGVGLQASCACTRCVENTVIFFYEDLLPLGDITRYNIYRKEEVCLIKTK